MRGRTARFGLADDTTAISEDKMDGVKRRRACAKEVKRDSGVRVMMTAAERQRLNALAAKMGISAAEIVRYAVAAVAEKHGVAA